MSQRIKGQEVAVAIVANNKLLDTITDVRSFSISLEVEQLQEGYLGETSDRYDDIVRGVSGNLELHFENQDILSLMRTINDRARRRTAGSQINISAVLSMPNGDRPQIQINDCFFGPIPLAFGSRGDYGTISLDFKASNFEVIGVNPII